jgi:thiol-disulfide isomerase/thioredoxin
LALWNGWHQPALRQPLLWGLVAGLLAWGAMFGVMSALNKASHSGLPMVSLNSLDGTPTDLAAMSKGRPMVVNLWATWCPPCRREMPVLAAAQQQESQVTFVFTNQGEGSAVVQRFLGASGLTLSNVLLDPVTALGRAVGSTALPTTLFYDASGQLVDTHLGELSAASLADKLNRLRSRANTSTEKVTTTIGSPQTFIGSGVGNGPSGGEGGVGRGGIGSGKGDGVPMSV